MMGRLDRHQSNRVHHNAWARVGGLISVEEIEKAKELAKKRVKAEEENKRLAEERRLEAQKKAEERERRLNIFLEELQKLIEAAEEGTSKLKDALSNFDARESQEEKRAAMATAES